MVPNQQNIYKHIQIHVSLTKTQSKYCVYIRRFGDSQIRLNSQIGVSTTIGVESQERLTPFGITGAQFISL